MTSNTYNPTQELSVASSGSHTHQSGGCPVCGGPVQAVERRAGEVSVAPCGHDITDVQAAALAAPERSTTREVATDGGEDQSVVSKTVDVSEEFQSMNAGGVQFAGIAGYHTYFDHSEGLEFALKTALHAALDEALEEVWLDADVIEDQHGELTPETAEDFLRNTLADYYDLPRGHQLNRRLGEAFSERLASFEQSLDETEVSE